MSFLKLFQKADLIASHRGSHSLYPENTFSALSHSLGHCDFVELDVQLSSDKVAVIMHDDTLERTTDIKQIEIYKTRVPYKLSDFTYAELASLDYGSWFYTNYMKPEPLLSLKKVLKFIKDNSLYINIEIKDIHDSFSDEEVISNIHQEIKDAKVKEFILLSSFRHEYLSLSKSIEPSIPTAALVSNVHPKNLLDYLKRFKIDAYHFNNKLVDKKTIKKLKEAGYFINIYTVNDSIRRQQLFDMGVNGVFTDLLE
ncbi:glycerophosphodiester phosphodiesterase family protein [Sulfurimonas sp.]|uniref:glycerophosphodiester phosphodiesterase n=1 Tax=Sulfurimonas sp. TaxID=2022749 RepID=UPI0025CFD3CB|nr:glycerophosphodiester phosphodiesterase family protein [Sulfurimonas sp.]